MAFMDGYKREPEMVEKLVDVIRRALYTFPEQRLGQIIVNANPGCENMNDLFSRYDEQFIETLETYIEDYGDLNLD